MALCLRLYLEISPVMWLPSRNQLSLTQQLHIRCTDLAGSVRASFVLSILSDNLRLVRHHARAILLLLAIIDQILLILQIDSREV
jgi:hypothetical protein